MARVRPQPTTQRSAAERSRLVLAAGAESRVTALLLGASMLAIWTWWALADGAFFATVSLPGAIVIYLLLAFTVGSTRLPISTRGPHGVALAAFFALAGWTALSLLWSPARDLALDYAQQNFAYAAAFAAGLALTCSLRRRMILSLAPFLAAGAVVALVVVFKVWSVTKVGDVVDLDGTLDFPFGYRNANAGFFAMVAFGALPLIARARTAVPIRAALAALAAFSLAVVVISQSRGSVLGVAAGVGVLLAVSRDRGRALVALAAVVAPVAVVTGELLDPFAARESGAALRELQGGIDAALIAGLVAGLLIAGCAVLERRGFAPNPRRPSRTALLLAGAGTAVAAVLAFSLLVGNPVTKLTDGLDGISTSDRSYGEVQGSRFTYAGGLNRIDFWKVALGQTESDPVLGGGAGSFRSAYLLHGDGIGNPPRNAHSLPLEVLGELGIVGLVLLVLGFGAAVVATLRSRRLGPEAATVSAAALTVAAVMLAQAAVDWSWYFSAQTAPVLALLGSGAAPAALALDPLPRRIRRFVPVTAGLLALIAAPTFASERLTLDAAKNWRGDTEGAYGALAAAADLNPFAEVPLLVEAQIAIDSNDAPRALAALERAKRRSPEDWRGYLLAARALTASDPEAALEQARSARSLNPNSDQIRTVLGRLTERVQGDSTPG